MTALGEQAAPIARPGQDGYDEATAVFNLAGPARPAAALTARSVEDIRSALRYATSAGLPLRVHATGHASAATRPINGVVLVRTRLDAPVEIDAERRIARVPAGARWRDVVEAAAPYGLSAPHGSAGGVGAVGYLLRGGLSFYGRKVGLAVNSIRAIEVVTADGELRRVDATADPELFWALRGGGGGLGVVTAVEIELFPLSRVVTGAAYWPAEHAPRLLSLWRRWTLDAPREATTSIRLMNLPPLPNVPPALAGGTVLAIDGAIGSRDEDTTVAEAYAADLLGPLRAVAEPVMDNWQTTTPLGVLTVHMDPEDPVAFHGDHMLLDDLGEDGLAEFLRLTGAGSGSPLVLAGLRQLGGAFADPHPAGGALSSLDARFSYAGSGVAMGGVTVEALRERCAAVRSALSTWDTGRTAPSFVESWAQPQGHLSADQVRKVDRVRLRVDPRGRFRDDIAPGSTALY